MGPRTLWIDGETTALPTSNLKTSVPRLNSAWKTWFSKIFLGQSQMLAGHHLFHYPINLLFSDYLMFAASASYLLIFPLTWLVVSFSIFHNIWDVILPNWCSYFSRWLKHVKTTNQSAEARGYMPGSPSSYQESSISAVAKTTDLVTAKIYACLNQKCNKIQTQIRYN